MEVCSPMKNGLVDNWELFEELLAYTLDQRLNGDVAHSPLMMTDPAWNTKEKRIKLTELIFEKFNSIAFYLVKSPVCTTFANGKSSGIVLDAGATHTTAVAGLFLELNFKKEFLRIPPKLFFSCHLFVVHCSANSISSSLRGPHSSPFDHKFAPWQ